MASIEVELFIVKHFSGWQEGETEVSTYRLDEMDHQDCVLIGQATSVVEYDEIDTTQAEIDKLNANIQKERADSQVRVNLLLERISKLTCITHEVI